MSWFVGSNNMGWLWSSDNMSWLRNNVDGFTNQMDWLWHWVHMWLRGNEFNSWWWNCAVFSAFSSSVVCYVVSISDWGVPVSPPIFWDFVIFKFLNVVGVGSPVKWLTIVMSSHLMTLVEYIFSSCVWVNMISFVLG